MADRKTCTSIILLAALLAVGCAKNPEPEFRTGDVSIAWLKSLYGRQPVVVTGDTYITGLVTSTDQYGNFYKTLFIEDDTGGICVRIDLEDYHRTYFRGMRLRIACNALVLSSYGGMLQLGAFSWDAATPDLGAIPRERLAAVITVCEGEDEAVEPPLLAIPDLTSAHIGQFVAFDGVQFGDNAAEHTWSEPTADTDRYLTDRAGNRIAVRTSHRATFAARPLPLRSGYIDGVATWFNGRYQLVVCSDMSAIMHEARF